MIASVRWLSALLGETVAPEDAARLLTLRAAAVDAVTPVFTDLGDIVIGRVERVEPHPDADRLTLCRVAAGGDALLDVVCGAPNVRAGQTYAYAPVGATLPGGFTLSKKKLRGVVSHGMLCSARELGLGTDHEGILPVPTDKAPGTPLLDAMPLADTRLEIDVTPNRPDLLCQRGVARELAAVSGGTVKLPPIPDSPGPGAAPRRVAGEGHVGGVRIVLEDAEGCPRYLAAVIRGVAIGPSPAWLQARLRAVGTRPINNVVDATNYILHELNQPLHAFDLATLRGRQIIIRRARDGERLTTLDGVERTLATHMTLICDGEGPVAIGGVMGGENSEVSAGTTDVLLECASFDPRGIRATRTALRLSTEASYRFERGVDRQAAPAALRRAVELIRAVAGGTEPEAPVDLCPTAPTPITVFLRPERVEHLLGTPIPRAEIERLLVSVGFAVAPRDERLAVQVPGWRPDVTREVDLIEEVARLRGYDTFPVERRPYRPTMIREDPVEGLKDGVRRLLTGLGLHEAVTTPFVPDTEGAPAIRNPLSREEGYLRTALLPGLARSAERNWAEHTATVRLFEIGTVFRDRGRGQRPVERLRVAGVLSGPRHPPHWTDGGHPPVVDAWDAKGILEEVTAVGAPAGTHVAAADGGWHVVDPDGVVRGRAGPVEADRPVWAAPLFGFELDLEPRPPTVVRFVPLPDTPAVERDVALVLPPGVQAGAVERIIRDGAGDLLEAARVFDEYRAGDLDGRSVAWRLRFRAPDRTLRDEEVDRVVERLLTVLEEELDVRLRQS